MCSELEAKSFFDLDYLSEHLLRQAPTCAQTLGRSKFMAPSSLPVSGPGYRSTSWSVHNGLLDVEAQSAAGTSDSDLKLESDDEVRATRRRRSVHESA